VGHALHQQRDADPERVGAVQDSVQQLAGGDSADRVSAGHQHPAHQPADRHVQVGSQETGLPHCPPIGA